MKPLYLSLPLLAAAACGQAPTGDLGAQPVPPVGPIDGFEGTQTMTGVHDLVVAVDRRGQLHRAGIATTFGWPVLILDDGTPRRFPGEGELLYGDQPNPAQTLAMRAQGDTLHLVWTDHTHVHYGRASLDGGELEHLRVAEASSGTANLAVRANGEVIITYTKGAWSRSPTRTLVMIEGTLEEGFTGPVHVNPACCDVDWAEEQAAYNVSVAAVELDAAGAIHIAYVWSNSDRGAVDYVTNASGEWAHGARIAGATFWLWSGVAMALGPDGIDFVYSEDGNRALSRVRYRAGALGTPEPVYSVAKDGDPITRVQMKRDGAGTLHLAVQRQVYAREGDRTELVYVRADDRGWTAMPMVPVETGMRQPSLSIGAGGAAITPEGEWIVPFSRLDGTAELVVGRARN